MSKARVVITAVILAGRTQAEVAKTYGVSKGWVSKLIARYNAVGEDAFEPRSRRPTSSPGALQPDAVSLILQLRKQLSSAGLDAGPDTIAWHLEHHHKTVVSRSSISRHLARAGLVSPEPKKRPQSSYIRFEAAMPNETWQSDFTHPDGRPGMTPPFRGINASTRPGAVQTAPHRHRPNPQGIPRHPAPPGPRNPCRQRRHRRTPTRPHPQPKPRLPTTKCKRSEPPVRVRIFPISCEITRSG